MGIADTFDEWLCENSLNDQSSAACLKREISAELTRAMTRSFVTPRTLAERMQTSSAAVERLLDPENEAVSLQSLYRAARALNVQLVVKIR